MAIPFTFCGCLFLKLSKTLKAEALEYTLIFKSPYMPRSIEQTVGFLQVALVVKNPPANAEEMWFDPWVEKSPWRRKPQPTPVFLPGEFHGQRSLAGYSPWGRKESDMTEVT